MLIGVDANANDMPIIHEAHINTLGAMILGADDQPQFGGVQGTTQPISYANAQAYDANQVKTDINLAAVIDAANK